MAGFVSNWTNLLISFGAVEKLNEGGLGLPDSKALKKRENEIKRLNKKSVDQVAELHGADENFIATLENQVEAGTSFAVGFKKMMQEQQWFKTEQDRTTGTSFTQVLWDEKAAPFFDRLKDESDFIEKQASVFSKQAKKGINWVRSLSAFTFAWEAVNQMEADYRRALADNLKGSMGFKEAEQDAWRALYGMDATRATLVATEFGEDYEALRRVQSQFYQLFRREITTQELRQMAALGRMMDLTAEDVAKYVFGRKREFGIDAETAEAELGEASVVFDDAVEAALRGSTHKVLAPMRSVFFQSLRSAQQSVHTMPQNMAVAARVFAEHLKQAVKAGITTPDGINKFIKQTTELAANDPHVQLSVGQELNRRIDGTIADLRRAAKLDPTKAPLDEMALRRQALERLYGSGLVAQAQLLDSYYVDTKKHSADSLKEMGKLFLQTTEGQATQLEVMQKLYDPLSQQEVFMTAQSTTQDPLYAASFANIVKSKGLLEMAQNLRQQELTRTADLTRSKVRLNQVIDAVSTLPLRAYGGLKAVWHNPWVKMSVALGLIGGGLWWETKVRRRLGMELSWAVKSLLRLSAALTRRTITDTAASSPTAKDTKRIGWLRTKLQAAWAKIRSGISKRRLLEKRWLKPLIALLRGARKLLNKLRQHWRRREMAQMKRDLRRRRHKEAKAGKKASRGLLGKALVAGEIGLAAYSYIDEKLTRQRMQDQQGEQAKQQSAAARQQEIPTTPEDIFELQAHQRIFADAYHMDLLSHMNYVTTFDVGQQDYADLERRQELVEVWHHTDSGKLSGVTVEQGAEFIKQHKPELYIFQIGGAVAEGLKWIKRNSAKTQ